MSDPLFSVIIPAYNQAEFLGEAIESVLNQTYQKFEVIVVDDGSTDNTSGIIKCYNDPRLIYINHDQNRGLPASRNTGIRKSSGEIVFLLDADDLFHPEKLQKHKEFLENHPEIGVSYNSRFELNHSEMTIRELWRPSLSVNLSDLVLGFPFSPSDMVIRREWLFKVGLFDESYIHFSEDLDINCRLALSGCKFASVDRALNYRRYHSGRITKHVDERLNAALRALRTTFADPRCPQDVLALRDIAFSKFAMLWSIIAFIQNETVLGQEKSIEAIKINPSILNKRPCQFVDSMVTSSTLDERKDHEEILRRIFDQLPEELKWLDSQYIWSIGHGYLLRGIRAIIWGRVDDGAALLEHAHRLGAQIDQPFLGRIVAHLLNFESEFGQDATQDVLENLSFYLGKIGGRTLERLLKGHYFINNAFISYRTGNYSNVVPSVIKASSENPKFLSNRGMFSILFRSVVHMGFRSAKPPIKQLTFRVPQI